MHSALRTQNLDADVSVRQLLLLPPTNRQLQVDINPGSRPQTTLPHSRALSYSTHNTSHRPTDTMPGSGPLASPQYTCTTLFTFKTRLRLT
jgi:hypothetical protein